MSNKFDFDDDDNVVFIAVFALVVVVVVEYRLRLALKTTTTTTTRELILSRQWLERRNARGENKQKVRQRTYLKFWLIVVIFQARVYLRWLFCCCCCCRRCVA